MSWKIYERWAMPTLRDLKFYGYATQAIKYHLWYQVRLIAYQKARPICALALMISI
ncbi:hypothetical protein H6G68_22130 [Anabaena catenula FACHB-362]|uniref:Uncharacterized protein n=1 Tax=Anabaena catenula FACHB-362 TaxID=2692877 RepID=A0ABR8JAA5_9NOST|nr:hypothetical protein [Anabaena catenula FACHB-362]